MPPKNTQSAVALLTDADEFQIESYRAMGIKIDGGHVALNAKAVGAALNQQIEAEYSSLYEISAILTRGPEYGQVELSVNGTVLGPPHDCYNPEPDSWNTGNLWHNSAKCRKQSYRVQRHREIT